MVLPHSLVLTWLQSSAFWRLIASDWLIRNNDGEDIWFSSGQGIRDPCIPGEQKSSLEKISGSHLYKEYRIYVYLESRKAALRRYLVFICTRNTGSMYTWRAEKLPGEDIWFSSGQGIQNSCIPGEQKSCLEKISGFHLYKEYRILVYLECRKAAWRRYLVLIWTRNTGSTIPRIQPRFICSGRTLWKLKGLKMIENS